MATIVYRNNGGGETTARASAQGETLSGDSAAGQLGITISQMLRVIVASRVTTVQGFGGAINLTSITFPNSLTSISEFGFFGCASLASVTIPNGVTSISEFAFYNCTSLTNIVWANPAALTVYLGTTAFSTNITNPPLGIVTYYETDGSGNLPPLLNPTPGGPESVYSNRYSITYNPGPLCFNKGTEILCFNEETGEEEYILIEYLRKGDLVKSYNHGYRKIDTILNKDMINTPSKWQSCMFKMKKTDTNGLTKDLIVTGGHSILVDDLGGMKEANDQTFGGLTPQIDGKYLLLASISKDFVKLENNDIYTWYHFILENDGDDDRRFGVWANGVLTETPSKNQITQMV